VAEVAERSTVEILRGAKERITPIHSWTTKANARTSFEVECRVTDPAACRWCVEGSLALELSRGKVDQSQAAIRRRLIESDAFRLLNSASDLGRSALVNDCRGHAETLEMCDHAIELAESEASNV
jgi:hypothetical protein